MRHVLNSKGGDDFNFQAGGKHVRPARAPKTRFVFSILELSRLLDHEQVKECFCLADQRTDCLPLRVVQYITMCHMIANPEILF